MNSQAVDDLNGLLKDELAAIEAYGEVLSKVGKNVPVHVLTECLGSHKIRAEKLRTAIVALNGQPIVDIGLGGKIAKLVIDGAQAINDEAMVAALGEDEGGWSSDYEWRLVSMHGDHRLLVKDELWPQQQKTEEKLREIVNSTTKGLWPATPGTKDI